MEDHILVSTDPLVIPASLQSSLDAAGAQLSSNEGSSSQIAGICNQCCSCRSSWGCEASDDEHLVPKVECPICQEKDSLHNKDIPCACRGTIKLAAAAELGFMLPAGRHHDLQFATSSVPAFGS